MSSATLRSFSSGSCILIFSMTASRSARSASASAIVGFLISVSYCASPCEEPYSGEWATRTSISICV